MTRFLSIFSSIHTPLLCPNAACAYLQKKVWFSSQTTNQFCKQCKQQLPDTERTSSLPTNIILLGSEHSGKTTWLIRSFAQLRSFTGNISFPIHAQKRQFEDYYTKLNHGNSLPRTPMAPQSAWIIDLRLANTNTRLYLHDTSGEESKDVVRLTRYRCLRYVTGIILFIDPFGLSPLVQRYGNLVRTMHPPVNPTPQTYSETHLSLLFQALHMYVKVAPGKKFNISVAIVITKLDVMRMYHYFKVTEKTDQDTLNELLKKRLCEWGMSNFISILDFYFKRVAYFISLPDGVDYTNNHAPILWLLDDTR